MATIARPRAALQPADDLRIERGSGTGAPRVWAATRIALGWVFLWAFLDKLFGLGFSTPASEAWVRGVSPTYGYLAFGTEGKALAGFFRGLSTPVADWLFMVGQLGLGVALILGIGLRAAAVSGSLLLALLWASQLPLERNPVVDEHIIFALVLIGLALAGAGRVWGLGRRWERTRLVRRFPALR